MEKAHPSGAKQTFSVKLPPQHIEALRRRVQTKNTSASNYLMDLIEKLPEFATLEQARLAADA